LNKLRRLKLVHELINEGFKENLYRLKNLRNKGYLKSNYSVNREKKGGNNNHFLTHLRFRPSQNLKSLRVGSNWVNNLT